MDLRKSYDSEQFKDAVMRDADRVGFMRHMGASRVCARGREQRLRASAKKSQALECGDVRRVHANINLMSANVVRLRTQSPPGQSCNQQ